MLKVKNGLPVAVLGAGNGGMAFAAYLSLQGCEVRLYDCDAAVLAPVGTSRTINIIDAHGQYAVPLARVTTEPGQAVRGAKLVMVVTPASAHATVAASIAPYLAGDVVIVLNPGRTGGALEVSRILMEHFGRRTPVIAETQTLLFACRKTSGDCVAIKGRKQSVKVAALPTKETLGVVSLLNEFFPEFVPAKNVLETSLGNIGAVFHPTPTLLNAARIETTAGDFEYYTEGISRSVAGLLEKIDGERLAVAGALNVPAISAVKWLQQSYGVPNCTNLYDAIQQNPAYRGIKSPDTINIRYITEDVPTGLVPLANLARKVGVATPVINTVINLACYMFKRDFWAEGRTLVKLGLENVSTEELRNIAV